MPNKLADSVVVALSQITSNLQQVTELTIRTPITGSDSVEIVPTLANLDIASHAVQAVAPLPVMVVTGADLTALIGDAYTRTQAYVAQAVAPPQALYAGIRDAVYAYVATHNGWSPQG